jgi:hypothetical protein
MALPTVMPTAPSAIALRSSKSERGNPKGNGRSPAPSLSLFASGCGDFFDEAGQLFGLPPSVGRIYGLLYGSPQPLSFTDIVEQLEISKGSASQGLQFLCSLGAIKEAPASGLPPPSSDDSPSHFHSQANASRRVAYEPELSLRRLVSGVLRERLDPLVAQGRERLKNLRVAAENAGTGEEREFQLDRLAQLGAWQRQASLIMPVFKTLLAVPRRNGSKKLA